MKVVLIGHGKMGKEIETRAKEKHIDIVSIFNRSRPLSAADLSEAEVCIDFSSPSAVINNIKYCAAAKKNVVIGTTGWSDQLNQVKQMVDESGIGLIHASNFSLGVNLFFMMVESASELVNSFPDYDAFVHEIHHNQKLDSPSGTALTIAEILIRHMERKKTILTNKSDGKIASENLHVTSTRIGAVPGTHIVGFDSAADSIELKHTARNRSGFALGALYAAEWIRGKKGIYTMKDVLT